jgi:hypothetical protein
MEGSWVLTASQLLSFHFIVLLVMGMTEVVKRILSRRIQDFNDYVPLVSIFWGVSLSLWSYFYGYIENPLLAFASGVFIGLYTSGLWDLGKRSLYNGVLGRIKG